MFKAPLLHPHPIRWQRRGFPSFLQQKPFGEAEITWHPAKASGDTAWERQVGEHLCRLRYLEQKYAELQIMAFGCHHGRLTLRFSCSHLHYCAAASHLGCYLVRQICVTWGPGHPEHQCSPRGVRLIAQTLRRSCASVSGFVDACVCEWVCVYTRVPPPGPIL